MEERENHVALTRKLGILSNYFSKTIPRIGTKLVFPPMDFIFYIISRAPLCSLILNIAWIILCIQTCLSSYVPMLAINPSSEKTEGMLKIIGTIFLEWCPKERALIIVKTAFYLHIWDLLLIICMVRAYYNRGMLTKVSCFAFMLYETIICTIFTPIVLNSCAIVFRLHRQRVLTGYTNLGLAIFTMLLQFRATLSYIIYNNYIGLSNYPYRNDVYMIYFSYLILTSSIPGFLYEGFSIRYAFIPFSVISLLFSLSFMYRPHLYEKFQSISANSCALFNGVVILINGLCVYKYDHSALIRISLYITFICFLVYWFWFKYVLDYSANAIRSDTFVENIKSGRVASYMIGYASMVGSMELADCTHLIELFQKFENDPSFGKHLAVCSCSLRKYPEELEPTLYSSDYLFGIKIHYLHLIELFDRIKGPRTSDEITLHNLRASIIVQGLIRLANAMSNLSDIVFHESTNVLDSNAIFVVRLFIETKIIAMSFIQKYPLSPASKVFIEALRVLTTAKDFNQELDFWSNFSYTSPLLRQYPELSLTKYLKTNPDVFVPKYGNFSNVLKRISTKTTERIKEFPRKEIMHSGSNGPFFISIKRPLYVFAFIILFCAPIVFFVLLRFESVSTSNVTSMLLDGYILLQNFSYLNSLMPFYTIENIGNNELFKHIYGNSVFKRIDGYLSHASQYVESCNNVNYRRNNEESHFVTAFRDYLRDASNLSQLLNGNFTNKVAFHEIVFSCYEVILDSIRTNGSNTKALKYTSANIIQTLTEFSDEMYNNLMRMENFDHPIANLSISNYGIIVVGCILFCLILIFIELVQGVKRAEFYYASLKSLSKSALIKLRARFDALGDSLKDIEAYFNSYKSNDPLFVSSQIKVFSIVKFVIVPMISFLVVGSFLLIASFALFRCDSLSSLNGLDMTRFMTKFIMNTSSIAAATHSIFFHYSYYDKEEIVKKAAATKDQIYNISKTKYQDESFCDACFKTYAQLFSFKKKADLETLADLYLTSSINLFNLLNESSFNFNMFQKLTMLYYDYIFVAFESIQDIILEKLNEGGEEKKPWMQINFALYLICCFSFYMILLRGITIGDLPHKYLDDLVSSLEIVDVSSESSALLDNKSFIADPTQVKLNPAIYNALRHSLNASVIIVDYQMNIISSNLNTSHLFVGEQPVEGVSIIEAMKSNFVDREQKLKLVHIINQYFYREENTIRSFEIEDTDDPSNTFDLLCIPLYIDDSSNLFRRSQEIPQVILIFNENKETVKLRSLVKYNKELPIKVMNDWMHPKISEQFNIHHNFTHKVCDSAFFAVVRIIGLTNIGGGVDVEQTIEGIDQIFRRFDMIVTSHTLLTKLRTHSSMYAIGTDLFSPPSIAPSVTMEFLHCLSDLVDETYKISYSKNIKLSIAIGASFGQVAIGLLGPQHPWLECWGPAVKDSLFILSHAKTNSISINPKIIDLTKDIDQYFTVTRVDYDNYNDNGSKGGYFISLEKHKKVKN